MIDFFGDVIPFFSHGDNKKKSGVSIIPISNITYVHPKVVSRSNKVLPFPKTIIRHLRPQHDGPVSALPSGSRFTACENGISTRATKTILDSEMIGLVWCGWTASCVFFAYTHRHWQKQQRRSLIWCENEWRCAWVSDFCGTRIINGGLL